MPQVHHKCTPGLLRTRKRLPRARAIPECLHLLPVLELLQHGLGDLPADEPVDQCHATALETNPDLRKIEVVFILGFAKNRIPAGKAVHKMLANRPPYAKG